VIGMSGSCDHRSARMTGDQPRPDRIWKSIERRLAELERRHPLRRGPGLPRLLRPSRHGRNEARCPSALTGQPRDQTARLPTALDIAFGQQKAISILNRAARHPKLACKASRRRKAAARLVGARGNAAPNPIVDLAIDGGRASSRDCGREARFCML